MTFKPVLLTIGVGLLALVQGLHFLDVLGLAAGTPVEWAALVMRANITPLAWLAYVAALCGLLGVMDGVSWIGRYRNRFIALWLFSVPCWCYFDYQNFSMPVYRPQVGAAFPWVTFARDMAGRAPAWIYVGLPPHFEDRLLGYLIAFGAIAPGMCLTAEVLQRLGFWRLRLRPMRLSARAKRAWVWAVFALGVVLTPMPLVVGMPTSALAMWVGTWALLDPINLACGRPSILRDWAAGRWGRTLSLGAAGLLCGFLWEFWNYWSLTKWVYHLPFLGAWEQYKYFEMPVPGLAGFIAFGIETWTMWQTALLLVSKVVEGEGKGDGTVREFGCV
jgi:hypothetical protein